MNKNALSKEQQIMMINEIGVLKKLDHSNILKLTDTFEDDD